MNNDIYFKHLYNNIRLPSKSWDNLDNIRLTSTKLIIFKISPTEVDKF